MNFITRFFHELRHPHCEHCVEERLELHHCKTCEVLSVQNSQLIRENERLMDLLLDKPKPQEVPVDINELKPIQTHIPWNVRRQQIEAERRAESISRQNAAVSDKDAELKFLKDLENG